MKYTKPMDETDLNAHYVDANPSLGIEGSIVPAAAIEPPQREIVNAITEAGLIPDGEDMTQLAQAIRALGMREATNDEIGGGYLAESINDPRELAFTNANTVRTAINNVAGANSIPTYYPGEFKDFFEETAPAGWAIRNGAVLDNADVNYPELWMELQKAENAFKLKTLTEWDSLSATAGGIGGVPYFVLDTSAKTIKLPDTRTDFFRDANGNIGTWQGDAIRNITGVTGPSAGAYVYYNGNSGLFRASGAVGRSSLPSLASDGNNQLTFDASRVVPTAPENRPRNISLLGCVCIEPAKAQRNEATTSTPGAVYLATGADDTRANAVPNVAMAAGLGMPSNRYVDLSFNATGVTHSEFFTAPADGYYTIAADNNDISLHLVVSNTVTGMGIEYGGGPAGDAGAVSLPTAKGANVEVRSNATIIMNFRFVYAQGVC